MLYLAHMIQLSMLMVYQSLNLLGFFSTLSFIKVNATLRPYKLVEYGKGLLIY
jgi:hypothetical protein